MKSEPSTAHRRTSSSSRSSRREAAKEPANPKGGFFTTWSPYKTAFVTGVFLSWFQGVLDTYVGDDPALRRLANIFVVLVAIGSHAWRDPVGRRVFGSLLFAMGSLCVMAFSSSIAWWRNPKHLDHLPDVVHEHVPFIDAVHVPYTEFMTGTGEPLVFTGLEIAELLMSFVIISTLVWVFSQPWRWLVFRRIMVVYGSLGLWRSVTILLTTLPDASPRCHTKTPGATALLDMPRGEVFTRGLSIFAFTILDPCRTAGDMVFSGHSMVLVLCGMAWHTYYGVRPGTFVVNPVKFIMWLTIIVALFMVVASRFHYTLDVILAVYFTVTLWGAYHRAADDILVGHRFVSVWVADGLIIYPAIEWMEAPLLGEAKQAGMVTKNLRIVARFKAKTTSGGAAAANSDAAGGAAAGAAGAATADNSGSGAAGAKPSDQHRHEHHQPSASPAPAGAHGPHGYYYPAHTGHTHAHPSAQQAGHGVPHPYLPPFVSGGYHPAMYPQGVGFQPYSGFEAAGGVGTASPRAAGWPGAVPSCPCCPPATSGGPASSPTSPAVAGAGAMAAAGEGGAPARRLTEQMEDGEGEAASRRRRVPTAASPVTEASDASSEAAASSGSHVGRGEDELSPALLAAAAEQLKHEDGTEALEPPSAGAVAYVEAVLRARQHATLDNSTVPEAAAPASAGRNRSRRNTMSGEGLSGGAAASGGAGVPTLLGAIRGGAPAAGGYLGSPEGVSRQLPIPGAMMSPPPAAGAAAAGAPGSYPPHLGGMFPHPSPPHHHHPHFAYPPHPAMMPGGPYMWPGAYPGPYGMPGYPGHMQGPPYGPAAGGSSGGVVGPGVPPGTSGRRGSIMRFDRGGAAGAGGRGSRPLPPGYVRVVSIQPRATFGADGGLGSGLVWDEDADDAEGEYYEEGGDWEGGEWEGGEWEDIDSALAAGGGGFRGRSHTGGPSASPYMGGMPGPGGYRSRAGSGVSTAGGVVPGPAGGVGASPVLGAMGYRRRRASTAGNGVLRAAPAGAADGMATAAASAADGDDGSASLRQVASLLARTFQSVYRAGRRNGPSSGRGGSSSSGDEERLRPQSLRVPSGGMGGGATTHIGASPVSGGAGLAASGSQSRAEAAVAAVTGVEEPARSKH